SGALEDRLARGASRPGSRGPARPDARGLGVRALGRQRRGRLPDTRGDLRYAVDVAPRARAGRRRVPLLPEPRAPLLGAPAGRGRAGLGAYRDLACAARLARRWPTA